MNRPIGVTVIAMLLLGSSVATIAPWTPGRGVRLMGPIVGAGMACAVAALCLRRVL